MNTSVLDIPSVVRSWSPKQKQVALATILRDYVAECGVVQPLPIEDEANETVGYLMPQLSVSRVEVVDLDGSTPYLQELQRRVESLDTAISLDEFIERADRRDVELGRV